ncbi:MAG: rhodanese-like domain-containing protein [Bosea sp. (in: a-proteobacteria)]
MTRRELLRGILRNALTATLGLCALPALAQNQPSAATPAATSALPSISVREAHERAKAGKSILVDIRRPEEWADTGVPQGAIKLDMTSPAFEAKLAGLRAENPGKPIDLICRTASRTRVVQEALIKRGWRNVVNVRGGLLGNPGNPGWLDEKLPVVP